MTNVSGPLAGVKVVDLTRVLAGPYCTMVLCDLGAEVVKIEHPRGGDDSRHIGPFINGVSAYFASLNRGKQSRTLDLKTPSDRDELEALFTPRAGEVKPERIRAGDDIPVRCGSWCARLRAAGRRTHRMATASEIETPRLETRRGPLPGS